jgi:hypothetical protein
MLIKSTHLKVIITTLALSISIAAVADDTQFKMAVVKNSIGSQNINVLAFNKNMDSCAVFTQAKKSNKSDLACTAAITSVKSIKSNSIKIKYLESLSYSNRAISRYINDDLSGAMDDLTTAILIDSNAKANFKLMKQRIRPVDSMDSIEFSD